MPTPYSQQMKIHCNESEDFQAVEAAAIENGRLDNPQDEPEDQGITVTDVEDNDEGSNNKDKSRWGSIIGEDMGIIPDDETNIKIIDPGTDNQQDILVANLAEGDGDQGATYDPKNQEATVGKIESTTRYGIVRRQF